MIRRLCTESGAVYEELDGKIRRLARDSDNPKRADGEWVALLVPLPNRNVEGERLWLTLEPLSSRGPDDSGNEGRAGSTTRITTIVVSDTMEGRRHEHGR